MLGRPSLIQTDKMLTMMTMIITDVPAAKFQQAELITSKLAPPDSSNFYIDVSNNNCT